MSFLGSDQLKCIEPDVTDIQIDTSKSQLGSFSIRLKVTCYTYVLFLLLLLFFLDSGSVRVFVQQDVDLPSVTVSASVVRVFGGTEVDVGP